MTVYRPPSYQQLVAIVRLARACGPHGDVDDQELRKLVGRYAGNIIEALIDRRFIFRNDRERWQLTETSEEIVAELLGEDWKAAWERAG